MRVIYMGRKPVASEGLLYLIDKGIGVVFVVTSLEEDRLVDLAIDSGIVAGNNDDLCYYLGKGKDYRLDLSNIDLVISFLHPKRILKPLIDLPKIGCINFHPAPLPEYRGFAPYTFGVYDCTPTWGVTCHFVDESFDTGNIIKQTRFNINPMNETAKSLQERSHYYTLELFKEVIDEALKNGKLSGTPQKQGKYHSKEDFEKIRQIKPSDTEDEIDKKIRAFWCPPNFGAYTEVNGIRYTLVNEKILKGLNK